MRCGSQGMGFCGGGWENSLTLEITLSPQRQRLLPVFTRVLSPLQHRILTCQLEQGRLSRWGIATLLYVPPGTAGSPWLQVLRGHVSQITQRDVSAILLEKSAKHWRQHSMCVFFTLKPTWKSCVDHIKFIFWSMTWCSFFVCLIY